MTEAAAPASRAKVFLSYSRRDSAFVDELIISIESYGFEVLLDREDLFPGEQWEPRLHRFISEADTTICVVSASWVASGQCVKELSIALDQGRRVIPVIIDQVHPKDMPPQLARLQFVFFQGEGRSYARGVVSLVEALRTDIEWVRQQSRMLDKAQEWASHGRSKALALRGASLDDALAWINGPRPEHTQILPMVAEFIEASRLAQDDEEKTRLRGRMWFMSVAGLALVGMLSTGLLTVETMRRAEAAKAAEQERLALAEQLRARELDEELTKTVFELNQGPDTEEDVLSSGRENPAPPTSQPAPVTGGVPASPGPAPHPPSAEPPADSKDQSPAATGLVAQLTAADKDTRVQAGQQVVEAIRAGDVRVIADLIGELEPARYAAINSSGRFNILYMLNVRSVWAGTPEAGVLTAALDRIEPGAGAQSKDCIERLRAKLAGKADAGDRCGGR